MTILLCLSIYLLIAQRLLQEPNGTVDNSRSATVTTPSAVNSLKPLQQSAPVVTEIVVDTNKAPPAAGRKRLEIHGRIVDSDGQPLAAVVVAEERYHHRTRSDAEGYYRLQLEIPRHRYPVLHFLRSGYDAARIKLGKRELDPAPVYGLDVELAAALDSVTVEGWVSNENGVGIVDARVELAASYARNHESFYLTEFSDARGNFRFEGIRAGQTYTLEVDHTPHYPRYRNSSFSVGRNPAPVHIELPAIQFLDIEGMMLTRDALPVANFEMQVTNLTTGTHKNTIISDSSGYFRLQQFPPGELELATRGPEFYQITGLELDASNYQGLVLTVDRGNHHLSGWVSDENGVVLENAMVTVDRKFSDGSILHTSYRSVRTDREGAFAFGDLGRGEHRVTAYAWGYEKQETRVGLDVPAKALHFRLRGSP